MVEIQRYLKFILLFSLISLNITTTQAQTYCSASGGCDEYIYTVQLNTLNNSATPCNNYSDYTGLSTTLEVGQSYTHSVTTATPGGQPLTGYQGDKLMAWIDWNQDGDFNDLDELIHEQSFYGFFQSNFTVPNHALSGSTRLRVRLFWSTSDPFATSCGTTSYGEVEDYTINVIGTGGTIEGTKFNDLNKNHTKDIGEPGLADWNIYLDLNNNGAHDLNEPNTVTDINGDYQFQNIAPGNYTIAESNVTGWTQTMPGGVGTYNVTLAAQQTVANIDFGNAQFATGGLSYLFPIADAYTDTGNPSQNFGSSTLLKFGKSSSSEFFPVLKFDLSSLPAGKAIVRARLRLNCSSLTGTLATIVNDRNNDDWLELEINAGNFFVPTELSPGDTDIILGDNFFDIPEESDKAYVQDQILTVYMTRFRLASNNGIAEFYSREFNTEQLRPYLEIEYAEGFTGDGSKDNPYQVTSGSEMALIGTLPSRWDKHFILMNNISLSQYTNQEFPIIGFTDNPFNFPNNNMPFTGSFNGNGFAISDFSYSDNGPRTSLIGLFGYVADGTIKNLELVSPNITYSFSQEFRNVGALVGYLDSFAKIYDCHVTGGTVEGEVNVGGFIGFIESGHISNCSSSADTTGFSSTGGFMGNSGSFLGGGGIISNCFARGNVSGEETIGGFAGDLSPLQIKNCYSTGSVLGSQDVGGFAGVTFTLPLNNISPIISCFWDTQTSGLLNSAAGIGLTTQQLQQENTFINEGWDFINELSNGGSDDWAMPNGGGYPIHWYTLQTPPALPIFAGGTGDINSPYQIANESQLNSIGHNPRLIDKHFIITNDLNMHGIDYKVIADLPYSFTGTIDGNNHTIKNIEISDPHFTQGHGLIGQLECSDALLKNIYLEKTTIDTYWSFFVGSIAGINKGGRIDNCHVKNCNIRSFSFTGGLVGTNTESALIENCSATGFIQVNPATFLFSGIGGLVGDNIFSSTIDQSYADVDIQGQNTCGGLVGQQYIFASISNCFALGDVNITSDYAGGLAGRSEGGTSIINSYASGKVTGIPTSRFLGGFLGRYREHDIQACFWDKSVNQDLNGVGSSDTGEDPDELFDETTDNLLKTSTFADKGWDFSSIWRLQKNMSRPRLQWMPYIGDFQANGVSIEDLTILSEHWLSRHLKYDHYPLCGDNIVNMRDWATLLSNTPNSYQIKNFILEWIQPGTSTPDFAPLGGDNIFNLIDFAAMACNWMVE